MSRELRAEVGVGRVRAEELADKGHVARLLLVGAAMRRELRVQMRPIDPIHLLAPPPQAAPRTLPEPVDGAKSSLRFASERRVLAVRNLCSIRHIFLVLTSG
jgi:hypothetical protein